MRKLISFDDDTFASLKELGRRRMATIQEIADEAFRDVLKKHDMPQNLRDALRKSIKDAGRTRGARKTPAPKPAARKTPGASRARLAKRKAR